MFGISTSWLTASTDYSGELIIDRIKQLGLNKIELGFSLSETQLDAILQLQKKGNIRIESVHNYCPVPEEYSLHDFTPDYFSLASTDENQRTKAIELTLKSIHTTAQADAKALIIHAGRVEIKERLRELVVLFDEGRKKTPVYHALIDDMRKERENSKKPYLEALLRSLDKILPVAEKFKISLCLENRFYRREIPSFDELGKIFLNFQNCRYLFYWHDVGHAQVSENLGLSNHQDYLKRYSDKLYGVHLHDVSGGKDHLVPGQGDFDFSRLTPYLQKNTLLIIEAHQPATTEQIVMGIAYLKKIFQAA